MRSDWGLYESWRKSFQHKHADMLKDYVSQKAQCCQWIRPGEVIEVNGFLLKKGYFYVGDFFEIPKSYKKKQYIQNNGSIYNRDYKLTRLLGPVIQIELPIERKKLEEKPFSSYFDMHPTHRYEYLSWLAEEKSLSEISLSTLAIYLFGIQLRMFLDDSTDEKERFDMINYSLELYISCLENNIEMLDLELFINAAIAFSFKGKELDILNGNSIHNKKSILNRICYNIIKHINKNQEIPIELISEDFINQVGMYVSSDIMKMVNPTEGVSHFCNYLSLNYDITRISGTLSDTLLCYDLALSIRLREDCQIFYAIKDCVKDFCKDMSRQLKEYKTVHNISPTLSLFALPSTFKIHDNVDAKLYLERLKKKTESQDYTAISINSILGIDEDAKGTGRKINKAQITSIIKCIGKIGYGIVPYFFVDEKRFNYGDICILFREKNNEEIDKVVSYKFEQLIKIGVYIVNNTCSDNDIIMIENYIKKEVNNVPTQKYLLAYLRWLLITSSYKLTKNNKDEITKLAEESKRRFVAFATCLTTYNNQSFPKRLDYLKNVLPLFNVDQQSIHTLIHRVVSEDEDFATIEKENCVTKYTIDKAFNHSISLSSEQLVKVEEQTKQAQDILADIFEDEETVSTSRDYNDIMSVLSVLLSKESWQRSEVESICQKHHLMIGSVLERINDYSYNKIEDAVIEDDGDTIYVMTEFKDKLI